jgi:hypothetical protein
MVNRIEKVAEWLTQQASEIADLVDTERFDDANRRIRDLRLELRPIRRDLAEVMKLLFDLGADFTEASGAVGA